MLMLSARDNRPNVAEALIEAKADLALLDAKKFTATHYAAHHGSGVCS